MDSDNRDRISDLPEALIQCIFSYLETKLVVQTCILSKQWKNLWASCVSLDLIQGKTSTDNFVNYVDMVLKKRLTEQSLARFQLICDQEDLDKSKISMWVDYAVRHKSRDILLVIPPSREGQIELPSTLFSSSSMENFCLVASYASFIPSRIPRLQVPENLCLRNLRQLGIGYLCTPARLLEHVLTCCPLLEFLLITVWGPVVIDGIAPKLMKLVLRLVIPYTAELSEFRLNTPRLQVLVCSFMGVLPQVFALRTRGLLKDLCVSRYKNNNDDSTQLAKIINVLPEAKILYLVDEAIQSLSTISDLAQYMSPFVSLRFLGIKTTLDEHATRGIANLLKGLTKLEELFIYNGKYGELRSDVNGIIHEWASQDLKYFDCYFKFLKKVEINGFLGSKDELDLINLLLNKATALENIILNIQKKLLSDEIWKKIRENLDAMTSLSYVSITIENIR